MVEAGQVAEWLQLFIDPGQVTELRALRVRMGQGWPHTEAGYFDHDHLNDMAKHALHLSRYAEGVYFIPNPVKPELLSRCCNRVKETRDDSKLTTDRQILRRRWLLVDADPVREDGISSTDAEKALARQSIEQARKFLAACGMDQVVLADSGNGYHLLVKIELQAEDHNSASEILNAVGNCVDIEQVKIDRKVFNASRIVKLYGTTARKGDDTPERPHRESRVLEVSWESEPKR